MKPMSADIIVLHEKHGDFYVKPSPTAYQNILKMRIKEGYFAGTNLEKAEAALESANKARHFIITRNRYEYEVVEEVNFMVL